MTSPIVIPTLAPSLRWDSSPGITHKLYFNSLNSMFKSSHPIYVGQYTCIRSYSFSGLATENMRPQFNNYLGQHNIHVHTYVYSCFYFNFGTKIKWGNFEVLKITGAWHSVNVLVTPITGTPESFHQLNASVTPIKRPMCAVLFNYAIDSQ